jgi:hypothetical protein
LNAPHSKFVSGPLGRYSCIPEHHAAFDFFVAGSVPRTFPSLPVLSSWVAISVATNTIRSPSLRGNVRGRAPAPIGTKSDDAPPLAPGKVAAAAERWLLTAGSLVRVRPGEPNKIKYLPLFSDQQKGSSLGLGYAMGTAPWAGGNPGSPATIELHDHARAGGRRTFGPHAIPAGRRWTPTTMTTLRWPTTTHFWRTSWMPWKIISAELPRRLYENARAGFREQMRKRDPPLDESHIKKEQIALEEAIRKVEAEQMSRASRQG